MSLEYSIGEIAIATIGSDEHPVTQGLLQPIMKIKDCKLIDLLPNAITPNNDHKNDCFGVKHWPVTSSYELSIFNIWGQLVFRTTNSLECWDGTFQQRPQPTGTYIYTIKANTAQCGQLTVKGAFLILR